MDAYLLFLAVMLSHPVMAQNTNGQVVPFQNLKPVDAPTEPLAPNKAGPAAGDSDESPGATANATPKRHAGQTDASDPTLFRWSEQAGKSSHPTGTAMGPPPLGDDPGPFGPYGPFKVDGEPGGKQWGLVTRDSDGNLMMQMGTNPSPDALAKQAAQPLNLSQNGQPVPPTAAALSSILAQRQIPPGLTINGKRISPGDQGEPGASGGA